MTASGSASRGAALIGGDEQTELSSVRTEMAFERTRMGMDRTLMATARASLSLTGFGFVIYELSSGDHAGYVLGLVMITLGVLILAVGVAAYGNLVHAHRRRRDGLHASGLLHSTASRGAPPTLLISALLLAVGALALAQTVFQFL